MVRGTRRCIRSSFGVETLGILSTYVQQANTCDPEDQERIRLHFTSTVDSYRSVICLGVGDMLHPANSTGPLLSAEKKHAEAGFLTCRTQERARRHFGTFCMNLRGGPPPPPSFSDSPGFSLLTSACVSRCSVPQSATQYQTAPCHFAQATVQHSAWHKTPTTPLQQVIPSTQNVARPRQKHTHVLFFTRKM